MGKKDITFRIFLLGGVLKMYYKGYALTEEGHDRVVVSKHKNESNMTFKNFEEAKTYLDRHTTLEIKPPFSILGNASKFAFCAVVLIAVAMKFFMGYSEAIKNGNTILGVMLAVFLIVIGVQVVLDILSCLNKKENAKVFNKHCVGCTPKDLALIIFDELFFEIIGAIITIILLCINF